jgi:hypothetical protein
VARPTANLIEFLAARSPSIAHELVDPLARFLTIAREGCGGDLDKAFLMMVITLRSSRHPDFRTLDISEFDDGDALPGFGTNVRSLADSTGIPKETVRRKVQQLIDLGWVVRNGWTLRYTADGYRAVEPGRAAILRMYALGYQLISGLDGVDQALEGDAS